ncbi:MAG TPA: DUF4258 domain-containing protein [bacterium]|nr:DUF4258 domain-containing protein [bacterium]
MDSRQPETAFSALTPLDFSVSVSRDRWNLITSLKHPAMSGREAEVQAVLQGPDEVRRSRRDESVLLFYKLERPGRWLCAVVRRAVQNGFLITAYPTDAVKEGERIWVK